MKEFEIKNNNVYFCSKNGEYKPIDSINKEELLFLINKLIDSDDFEMDEYNDELIKNEAHKIIYRNVFNKFSELMKNKKSFKDQYSGLFEAALNKYKNEI